tara:strand:- start:4892 stop:6247 length:1356 start_codon:yes stop_codon:yes gene_type:complete
MQNMNIAIVGASGFIGSNLIRRLLEDEKINIYALSRRQKEDKVIRWRRCDFFSVLQGERALKDIDVAIYLVHSMMPSAALCQGSFDNYDIILADNFVRACRFNGVKKIIYLGGILPYDDLSNLSPHLKSRLEVEYVLASSNIPCISLRAGLIIGKSGSSFRILNQLLNYFPFVLIDSRFKNRCDPIYVNDVTEIIHNLIHEEYSESHVFDIAGDETISYKQLLIEVAKAKRKKLHFLPTPIKNDFILCKIASWIISIPYELVYPLFQSLKHDMLARRNSLYKLKRPPTPFQLAIEESISDESITIRNPQIPLNDVRSVIRISNDQNISVEKIAFEYYAWLPKFFKPWIDVKVENRIISFYAVFFKKPLLVLKHSLDRSSRRRHLFYIVGGMLAKIEGRGRLEFRSVLDGRTVIAAIHSFRPALPWFIYVITQAPIHWFVMRAFSKHIKSLK